MPKVQWDVHRYRYCELLLSLRSEIRLEGTYMTDYEKGYERGRDEILAMKENADGCCGCAFEHVEPWELPCRKCKRNSKDYWRKKCDLDE